MRSDYETPRYHLFTCPLITKASNSWWIHWNSDIDACRCGTFASTDWPSSAGSSPTPLSSRPCSGACSTKSMASSPRRTKSDCAIPTTTYTQCKDPDGYQIYRRLGVFCTRTKVKPATPATLEIMSFYLNATSCIQIWIISHTSFDRKPRIHSSLYLC